MSVEAKQATRKRPVRWMFAALVVLTAAPAVAHGLLSQRWRPAADLSTAALNLEAFPRQFTDWKQQGDEEQMPQDAIDELQCAGYFNRRYVNQKLGRDVTVMLMVGPSGPLIRHPPEICYGNRANRLLYDPVTLTVETPDSQSHTVRLLRYKNPAVASGEFSVCYGWSADGSWSVPDYPRVTYGGAPRLYKLQVLTTDAVGEHGTLPAATARFLDDFLPLLRDRMLAAN
jgi:hypothetical protein